jgi:hypothetical protein
LTEAKLFDIRNFKKFWRELEFSQDHGNLSNHYPGLEKFGEAREQIKGSL